MKRIGYCKLGRSWGMDAKKASTVGGDIDVIRLLKRLAERSPDIEFFLIGRNSGHNPQALGLPSNVINPWDKDGMAWKIPSISAAMANKDPANLQVPINAFRELAANLELDGLIMWMGQHHMSSTPIPQVGGSWSAGPFVNPQVSGVNYSSYLIDYCNRMNLEPVMLVPDVRNYVKPRDLSVDITLPVLAQYKMKRDYKQDRGALDPRGVTIVKHEYVYSGIELTALDHPDEILFDSSREAWEKKSNLVIISNENKRTTASMNRGPLIRQWITANFPATKVYGSWSDAGVKELGYSEGYAPESIPNSEMYNTLRSAKATMTFPASGSGWATSKVWEAFAAGTVCFIHPKYDTQGLILPRNGADDLSAFLHVRFPQEVKQKVQALTEDYELWKRVVEKQRKFFEHRFFSYGGGAWMVEKVLREQMEKNEETQKEKQA